MVNTTASRCSRKPACISWRLVGADHALLRPRINVDLLLYSRRFHSRRPALERSRAEYLLLGAVSSGFILYGFSLLYGIAGSTELADISTAVSRHKRRSVCHRCGSHDCGGAALQNIRRAVSHVGA